MKRLLLLTCFVPVIALATPTNNLAQYRLGAAQLGMAMSQFKLAVTPPKDDLLACHHDHKKLLCHFLDKTGAVAHTTILGSVPAKTSYYFVGNQQNGILQSIHSTFSLSQYDNVKAALIKQYGQPTGAEHGKQKLYGATMHYLILQWQNSLSEMRLDQHGSGSVKALLTIRMLSQQ